MSSSVDSKSLSDIIEGLKEFEGLKVIGNRLYYRDKPISTGFHLEGWTLVAAWVAAGTSLVGTAFGIIKDLPAFWAAIHPPAAEAQYIHVVERHCPIEVQFNQKKGTFVSSELPCLQRVVKVPVRKEPITAGE